MNRSGVTPDNTSEEERSEEEGSEEDPYELPEELGGWGYLLQDELGTEVGLVKYRGYKFTMFLRGA